MVNKIKIVATVVVLLVGMVMYKQRFDRLEREKVRSKN